MGVMRILDRTGDTAVTWELDDPASLDEAEYMFNRLSAESKIAFARPPGAPAHHAEHIWTFDPMAEEIIWVRPLQGG